ncbi:MAG: alpha/beta fold hydrolase [Gemmatimonas sp.]
MNATAMMPERETHPCEVEAPTRVPVRIIAQDGYVLTGERFIPDTLPRGFIVIAGAVGVPQRFYCRFAEFARQQGYEVMTFDYRGIARSAPQTLRGFSMDIRDWGKLDLSVVIDINADEAERRGVPLFVVAHSFGGQAFGMVPNHDRVQAVFTYGTGAGWHGWMPWAEQLRVLALWNFVGPLLTGWSRYLSWSKLGMGEDLPLSVFRQWRRWCRNPHYFFDDPDIGVEMRELFARVRTPMLAMAATDDRWSPPKSRNAFLTGYCNAAVATIDVNPALSELAALGHMGYFRSGAAKMWPRVLEWFESKRA